MSARFPCAPGHVAFCNAELSLSSFGKYDGQLGFVAARIGILTRPRQVASLVECPRVFRMWLLGALILNVSCSVSDFAGLFCESCMDCILPALFSECGPGPTLRAQQVPYCRRSCASTFMYLSLQNFLLQLTWGSRTLTCSVFTF